MTTSSVLCPGGAMQHAEESSSNGQSECPHRETSNRLRWFAVVLGAVLGGWLVIDGGRALATGDYFTPSTGPHAGELGPWSMLVAGVGIDPRSTMMKGLHVALGLCWLAAASGLAANRSSASRALLGCALASL